MSSFWLDRPTFVTEDLWNGYPKETNAPYSLTPKIVLMQSQDYREQYGFNSSFLLPVHLYGPRDNFDLHNSRVIPALICKCLEARDSGAAEIIAWGDGSPTREFLYVEDAAERYDGSGPVNLGSADKISIKDLTETVARLTGFTSQIVWDTSQPNGQPRCKLDTSRAKERFGFEARTSFEEGLRKAIDWYKQSR